MDAELYLKLYRFMRMARRMDEIESELARRGEASFHIACAGHEATVALWPHLIEADWLHAHYRDRSLLLARGLPPERWFHSLMATRESCSEGRDMPPFQCDPARHVLGMPTLVGNNALQAVGVAAAIRDRAERPLVLCALGDGGSQEGEVLEAIAEAARSTLPVLFVVEDNHYALSTPTAGRTFYSLPGGEAHEFCGVPITRIDGRDTVAAVAAYGRIVRAMRADRAPRIVVFQCERIGSHSNSDDQTVYRSPKEMKSARDGDPLVGLAERLAEAGVSPAQLRAVEEEIEKTLQRAVEAARAAAAPEPGEARKPLPPGADLLTRECRGERTADGLTLLEALRETLRAHLRREGEVTVCGQDIEDPKGDVFGVTRGLSTDFPGRVRNAPLSESTIVGMAIGRALVGGRPVAFLQFADFFPVAYNQISAELGPMYWRTAGRFEAPVIVMAVTGGYRPGLGPCHAQSPEAVMAHVPGLDVFMPSTAADAAGLLNAIFESARPSVFFYPKNLLNDRENLAPADVEKLFVPIGRARIVRAGGDLTFVGWGNTVALCEKAADVLAKAGVEAEVIDLRTLSPWDKETVIASASRTGHLIVTHEDMHTCGLGAEVLATVAEAARAPVQMARVTGPDALLPFHYENQLAVLPSVKRLLGRAAELLDLDLRWERPEAEEAGMCTVRAIGSSPSDESIRIVALHVQRGEAVAEGRLLASVEADKASMDISAPAQGVVTEVLAATGDVLRVGTPILRLRVAESAARRAPAAEEIPVLRKRRRVRRHAAAAAEASGETVPVILSSICSKLGAREMRNEDFLQRFPEWTSQDVLQRTGIERRFWIGENESVVTLAVQAARELLERERLAISDFDVLICSTGTPPTMTPSLACRILKELSPEKGEVMVQAYDVNAACSGYLYALQCAHDCIKVRPDARIMVVTAETLSPLLDPKDPGTLFLFGDAATATLVSREPGRGAAHPVSLLRPVLSAKGEDERVLCVPALGSRGYVTMEGQQVFRVAVRKMIEMLETACRESGLKVADLSMIVPHQANERIIEAIRTKIKAPPERMFNHIRNFANTSSNTLPLALQTVLPKQARGSKVGLVAFGGGFTFGAAILDVV